MVANLFTGQPARNSGQQNVQAIAGTFAFNTVGIGTADTVKLGTLPSGAQILACYVRITTAFNAVTTNVLTVGTSSGSDADILADGDVDETSTGTAVVVRGCDLTLTSDTAVYVKYTQTGTAATTGSAVITVTYVIPTN